jgi:hypothetical protein
LKLRWVARKREVAPAADGAQDTGKNLKERIEE